MCVIVLLSERGLKYHLADVRFSINRVLSLIFLSNDLVCSFLKFRLFSCVLFNTTEVAERWKEVTYLVTFINCD